MWTCLSPSGLEFSWYFESMPPYILIKSRVPWKVLQYDSNPWTSITLLTWPPLIFPLDNLKRNNYRIGRVEDVAKCKQCKFPQKRISQGKTGSIISTKKNLLDHFVWVLHGQMGTPKYSLQHSENPSNTISEELNWICLVYSDHLGWYFNK